MASDGVTEEVRFLKAVNDRDIVSPEVTNTS